MNNITVIIISKNDSDVIGNAILSARKLTSEIIVIDSNPDDLTQQVCQRLKVRNIKNPFKNFSDQRNFGMSYATTDWVMYLDSDERITDDFASELIKEIKNFDEHQGIGGFRVKRKTYFYGQDWNFLDQVERVFLRKNFLEWKGVVHETPVIKGRFKEIKSPILHYTHRNLSQMVRKTNEWSDYEANLRFKNQHPRLAPWRFFRVMITAFLKSYIQEKGYRNGTYGIIEALFQAFSIFITYAKLWEMQTLKTTTKVIKNELTKI